MIKFLKYFWVDFLLMLILSYCLYMDSNDGRGTLPDIFWLSVTVGYFFVRLYNYFKFRWHLDNSI